MSLHVNCETAQPFVYLYGLLISCLGKFWNKLATKHHQTSQCHINATSMPPLSGHGHADGQGPWPWRSCAEGMNGINGINGTGRDEQAAIRSLF